MDPARVRRRLIIWWPDAAELRAEEHETKDVQMAKPDDLYICRNLKWALENVFISEDEDNNSHGY
jgi:hypothetical protein